MCIRDRGQTIGIIGGTGSGKSTLVNMIPRFYDATTGAVLVDGVDVKEYSFEPLRDKIGIVPQKAVLFKGTIRDNIRWGKKDATDEEIYEALRTAQAAAFVEEKNEGLDLPILQGGKNLSGGQKPVSYTHLRHRLSDNIRSYQNWMYGGRAKCLYFADTRQRVL